MARTINILPESLANKIAAGEVVQRPASVVKELVENSIDAGANSCTVVIKESGRTLIQVTDDGCGMTPEDAAVAFERHSTSKISSLSDLEKIRTLGFRGEALASIAAVSQTELRTRPAQADVGTKVRIEGGLTIDIVDEAMPAGTTVVVRNLFYNTPARRKFLKSTPTEFKYIFDVLQRVAISSHNREVRFVSNDETVFHVRPATFEERIKSLFGEKLFDTIFRFEERSEFVAVTGFLGKPQYGRKSRVEQYIFLNGRPIINRSLNHAVLQAYEHLLEKGSFPFFILLLTIDPERVDVNVHPSKMEVKFEDESSMYRFVLAAVRNALAGHDFAPALSGRGETSGRADFGLRFDRTARGETPRAASWRDMLETGPARAQAPQGQDALTAGRTIVDKIEEAFTSESAVAPRPASPSDRPSSVDAPLWQVHNKYILVPVESGLMIVDQHAAHERIIYEHAVERFHRDEKKSQQLLFPHTIELNAGDAAIVRQLQPLLENLGFNFKFFGKSTVILDGIPQDVNPGHEGTILQDVLDLYKADDQSIKLEPRERLAKSFSCKAAVKAGDPLHDAEMRSLLDQLFATHVPFVCPHGRPVMVKLSLSELDKRFGRTS